MRSITAQSLFAKAALIVLLAFQLVVGPSVQAAAAVAAMAHAARVSASGAVPKATAHADCPMHRGAMHSGATHNAHALTGAQSNSDSQQGSSPDGSPGSHGSHGSQGSHDCCRLAACQCQCLQTPALFDALTLNTLPTSRVLPLLSSAQFVAPRIDEFLRPPIA